MRNWKKILGAVLLAAYCFLPVQAAECSGKAVPTSFGSITLPENAYIVEYDLKNDLESLEPRMRREVEKIAHLLNVYVITVNDGESYRSSVAIAFFFDNQLLREGREQLTEEQKERLSFRLGDWQRDDVQRLQGYIDNQLKVWLYEGKAMVNTKKMYKISFDDKFNWQDNPTGLVDYEWDGINTTRINGEYGYTSKGRFAAYVLGILTSFYFEEYAHNLGDRGVSSLTFICVDSEREYWAPIFAGAVE